MAHRSGLPFPDRVLLDGRSEPPVRARRIDFGGFAFHLSGVDVRQLRWGGSELLDSVYVSVRDRNWDTIPAEVRNLRIDRPPGGPLALSFLARNRSTEIDFAWRGSITVADGGPIVYEMEGEAGSDFLYCRIGFCILHAASTAAGRPYAAETPAGRVSGVFPDLVAPQEVVDGRDLPLFPTCSALSVDLGGVVVRTAFDGSLFATEDQRNWTDASFKTCCVRSDVYPYQARRGQPFSQRVTVDVSGNPARRVTKTARAVPIELDRASRANWPTIGLGESSQVERSLSELEARRMRSLRVDHLRADIHLSDPDWRRRLAVAETDAVAADTALEVALFADEATAHELPSFAAALDPGHTARLIVLHEPTAGNETTPLDWFQRVRRVFDQRWPSLPLFGGTDGDFAELNRTRPSHGKFDGLAYSMNPQVHAFDDESLVSTLAAQATTVWTTRSFSGALPVIVSPVTLRQRFNPAASDVPTPIAEGALPQPVDPRQVSLFAAAWTLGSIVSLAAAGAASITYFETVGWRGIMEVSRGPRPSNDFPSRPGMVFPVYHVFADLAGRRGSGRLQARWAGSTLAAVGVAGQGTTRALVANLSADTVTVALGSLPGRIAAVRILNDRTLPTAVFAPSQFRRTHDRMPLDRGVLTVTLGPLAYLRVDAGR